MWIKSFGKKLCIFIFVIFSSNLFSANTNEVFRNGVYIVENLSQTGRKAKFDIWVRGPADAVVEIFDKNGKRVGWKSIPGKKGISDIVGDIGEKWGDIYKDIRDGTVGEGQRSHTVSKKSTVTFNIPKGGTFKISKSSDIAKAVNYANTGLELLGKIGITSKVFGKTAGESAASAFADALIARPLLLTALSKANNSEFSTKELYTELAKVGIDVLKSAAIASGDNVAKNILNGVSKKILEGGISATIKGAEFTAFLLNNDSVRRDLNSNYTNRDKLDIVGSDTPQEDKILKAKVHTVKKEEPLVLSGKEKEKKLEPKIESNPNLIDDKNDKTLANLKTKDDELKAKIKGINEKENKLAAKKDELRRAKDRLASTNKYNIVQVNKSTKSYDTKKVGYLQRAKELVSKNGGKSFSLWSKSDQVSMGIIARNLGLSSNVQSITQKGRFLETVLKREDFNTLKDRYASITTTTTGTRGEYNYDYQRAESLVNTLENEVQNALVALENEKQSIKILEAEKNQLMASVIDAVDDYNNEVKTQIVSQLDTTTQVQGEIWLGSITMNSEDRLAGGATKLRYWAGQFGQSVDEVVLYSGGGPIFNDENGYKITNGKVTSFEIGLGQNTPTDNTKEFHIFNNEIDKTSSFYDDNLNTLKLERQLPGGETLSIQTTGHYDYSAWGEWGQTGGLYTDINGGTGIEQKATHNNWQVGQRTQDLPTQGSATYVGVVNGHYYQGSIGSEYGGKINGTMSMTVDFANTSVVAGVLNLKKENGATFATAHMDQMQLNRAESGFAGRLIGADVAIRDCANCGSQNMIVGQFNGPSAQEVSGIWNITNSSDQQASGTFAGKK